MAFFSYASQIKFLRRLVQPLQPSYRYRYRRPDVPHMFGLVQGLTVKGQSFHVPGNDRADSDAC